MSVLECSAGVDERRGRKGREKGRKTVNIPKKERKEGKRYPGPRSLEDTYASKKIKTQKKINKIIREENKERTPGGTKKRFKKN